MKSYVKPTIDLIELKPEERLARGSGTSGGCGSGPKPPSPPKPKMPCGYCLDPKFPGRLCDWLF
jgi:hypothetical protein